MLLTDQIIKEAKPKPGKVYKLSDGKGLYLIITPANSRLWRFDYRFDGKRKTISFGALNETSLQQARIKRDQAREQLADGYDPSEIRKPKKLPKRQIEELKKSVKILGDYCCKLEAMIKTGSVISFNLVESDNDGEKTVTLTIKSTE